MLNKFKEEISSLKFKALEGALYSRSGLYFLESYPLLYLDQLLRFGKLKMPDETLPQKDLIEEIQNLIRHDIENIKNDVYPTSAFRLEKPLSHAYNLVKIYKDAVKVNWNKRNNKSKVFSKEAAAKGQELPDYYVRNFHNQTDGYLSEESAKMYDQQVEILFRGTADPMRRMILEPLRENFERNQRFRLIEVGCGTGVSTFPISKTFKNARITATDLSEDYIQFAKQEYRKLKNTVFQQEQGEFLSAVKDSSHDAWCSTYMFHELPKNARSAVLKEAFRVLKPGGKLYIVDSIQKDDNPAFNSVLEQFPQNFHEPFYKNYTQTPMESLIAESGFIGVESKYRFSSKVCWATKPCKEN